MCDSKDIDVDIGSVTESRDIAEAMAEIGESLHGEDIMVEVLGSDVFVDGVCTSSGEGIGENDDDEDVVRGGGDESGEVLQEKEMKYLDVGDDSAWEVLHCGTVTDGQALMEELLEEGVERYESKDERVFANGVRSPIVENGVKSSSAIEEASVGEQNRELDEESDARNNFDDLKVIPDDAGVRESEIETTVVCSSVVVESVRKYNEMSAFSEAEGAKNDALDEGSVDKLKANVEVAGESIEDHNNSVVEGGDVKVLSNSEKDHQPIVDESLDEELANDGRHVKSSIAERIEVEPQCIEEHTSVEDGVSGMDIADENTGIRQVHLDGVVGHSNLSSEDTSKKNPETKSSITHKRKHNLESPTVAKTCKTFDSPVDDSVIQDRIKSMSLAKVSHTITTSKQSFKINGCIQRAATQLNGSLSILRCNNDSGDNFGVSLEDLEDAQMILPTECSSADELLSQLHSAAQDPFQGYSFSNSVVSFFSDFRGSIVPSQNAVMEKGVAKRKMSSNSISGFSETFEFVDVNDSYWTDMVVQNGSLGQLSKKSKRGECQILPAALEPEKSTHVSHRPYSRKQCRVVNNEQTAETRVYMDERRRVSPAEIIMTFSTVNSVPAETNLNKMFRRFGPLRESETEVDRETCRARVVYKKGSDAEVAYSSAGKFNIFGPVVVNYRLNFYPFEPFKAALYIPSIEGLEEATLYLHSQS